jgi:transposase
MLDYQLDQQELTERLAAHRAARDVREAYRINAVILLAKGRTAADVADALLIDPDTVRDDYKRYKKGGVTGLLRMSYIGREALLNDLQLAELERHLRTHLYLTAEAVARYVEKQWGVRYTQSGMTAVLHRLGYVYKKAKLEPGKPPEVDVQEAFVEKYENMKKNKAEGDVMYFMNATHP